MIKIVQLNASAGFGGGEVVMFDIVSRLKDEFQFLIAVPEGAFQKRYKKMKLPIFSLYSQGLLKNILKIKKIIKKEKPEILHCHGTRAAFLARMAAIGLKIQPKIIYTLHGFHLPRKNFFSRYCLLVLERLLNYLTDVLVCVSEADKNLVLKYKTIAPERIKIIKNGIDIEKFRVKEKKVQAIKRELGLDNQFILISIGRLHPQKDFSTVLKALKMVLPKIGKVKLLIVGDGPLRKSLEKEAIDLGIGKFVKFLGWREDIPVLINFSDIVILSTKWEGLPLVPLEAGAAKKPVIASDVDGVRETIINGKTGFLFQPGSAEDLAEKILKLFKEKDLRQNLGEAAYNFVLENFNKEKMIRSYRNLYLSLV